MIIKKRILLTPLLAVSFWFLMSSVAYAACSNPAGQEGDMVYNPTHSTMQFCDGGSWFSMKGGIGKSCGDGDVPVWDAGDGDWDCGVGGGGADNLGNHTATSTLLMGANKINFTGVTSTAEPTGGGGGGGGSDNLGDHTATQNLDLNGNDIIGAVNITYSGTLTDTSDRRLKTDIVSLSAGGTLLDKVSSIDTYSFRMKSNSGGAREFGVMAQELEIIFPELVKTANDEMGTKSVNYIGLISPMIEATKELAAENKKLEKDVAELRGQVDFLINKVTAQNADKAGFATGWGVALVFGMLSVGLGWSVLTRRSRA